jgi:hypothetical protein
LTLYGTGAGPESLAGGFKHNENYQRAAMESRSEAVEDMKDWEKTKAYLGKEKYYADFLRFYQAEIDRIGYQAMINEYLFKGDERADDLLQRMFAGLSNYNPTFRHGHSIPPTGFLHPLIQLLYGMEWEQPAIIAEAFAQAAVHKNLMSRFLVESEKLAAASTDKMPPIIELIKASATDPKLSRSAEFNDDNKIYDGVLIRAPEEAMKLAGKVRVLPEDLEEKTAEMFHIATYTALAAASHPPKKFMVDFFLM